MRACVCVCEIHACAHVCACVSWRCKNASEGGTRQNELRRQVMRPQVTHLSLAMS